MAKNVNGLELLHIKTYTYDSQRKKFLRQNVAFFISFIILVINLIIQIPKLNLDTLFGKTLFLISIGLVFFDMIIYIPIYCINFSLLKSHKRRKSLLFLYTIKKYERIIGSIFYICYFFLIMPSEMRNKGFLAWLEFFKNNLLISISLFVTAITLFIINSNKHLKDVKKEVLDLENVIEVYETNKETKDVTVKVYNNQKGKISKLFYNIKLFVVLTVILAVFVVFVIYMLKIKLEG